MADESPERGAMPEVRATSIRAEIGRVRLDRDAAGALAAGRVIPLDAVPGDLLRLMDGGRHVADAELLVDDGELVLRIVRLA